MGRAVPLQLVAEYNTLPLVRQVDGEIFRRQKCAGRVAPYGQLVLIETGESQCFIRLSPARNSSRVTTRQDYNTELRLAICCMTKSRNAPKRMPLTRDPSRLRSATVLSATSWSPTTSMYGTFMS
jgi:hypothetical protein